MKRGRQILSLRDVVDRLNSDGRGIRIVESSYSGVKYPAKFICPKTSLVWEMAPHRVFDGRGCPCCRSERRSKAAKKIWRDSVKRANISNAIRISHELPRYKSKASASLKKAFSNPATRVKMSESAKRDRARPERKRSMRENAQGWTADSWIAKGIDELYLYIVEFIGAGLFKIGITTDRKRRYAQFPYEVRTIAEIKGTTRVICDMEKELKRQHKPYKVRGKSLLAEFGGGTEVFSELVGYSIS